MKYTDFIREIEQDPEYKEAREALKPHFALGDAVLRARLKRGWSQAELASHAGTKQANISRIEAGLGNPTMNLVQKLIQVLELDINFTPAPSTTTSKVVSFGQPGIAVPNWPRAGQQNASNAEKRVQVDGGRS